MIKADQVARHVRVKFIYGYEPTSISTQNLLEDEEYMYIRDAKVYNDSHGEWVYLRGASKLNSGIAYLDELLLEFPID
jgi:hypothetical protein